VARFGMGLREHPKYTIVRILGLVRTQVLEAGAMLLQRGQIADPSQVWHLSFEELAQALDDPKRQLQAELAQRVEQFRRDQARKPPLIISSEGETPTLTPDTADLPAGALCGTAASNGVVEGPARVIRDPEHEVLHAGEILVARFTDPGWTPLFVHAAGVVTEVGGVLTHGGVVAREYGIPAVVSVSGALDRIRSGQRLRVDGTRGFVQILDE
jgi:pyruvate,water dikinase